jgi:DnaK suppressor protein
MKHLTDSDRSAVAQQLGFMRQEVLDALRDSAPSAYAQFGLNESHDIRTRSEDAEAEREDEVRQIEVEAWRRRLQDIDAALSRLAEGSYGLCATCGCEIPAARLLAQPIAIRCADCQSRSEAGPR